MILTICSIGQNKENWNNILKDLPHHLSLDSSKIPFANLHDHTSKINFQIET